MGVDARFRIKLLPAMSLLAEFSISEILVREAPRDRLRFDGEWFESVATPSVDLKRFAGGWGQQAFLVSLPSQQVVGVDRRAITMRRPRHHGAAEGLPRRDRPWRGDGVDGAMFEPFGARGPNFLGRDRNSWPLTSGIVDSS
jgi:hypothetical protein